MSTAGLRRVGHYEEALAQALKDESRTEGIISVGMQNYATQAINNPEFQRVKDRLEENLADQQKALLEHQSFKNNITNLAVEARVNRSDLDYIVSNLQQPPPPQLLLNSLPIRRPTDNDSSQSWTAWPKRGRSR